MAKEEFDIVIDTREFNETVSVREVAPTEYESVLIKVSLDARHVASKLAGYFQNAKRIVFEYPEDSENRMEMDKAALERNFHRLNMDISKNRYVLEGTNRKKYDGPQLVSIEDDIELSRQHVAPVVPEPYQEDTTPDDEPVTGYPENPDMEVKDGVVTNKNTDNDDPKGEKQVERDKQSRGSSK